MMNSDQDAIFDFSIMSLPKYCPGCDRIRYIDCNSWPG
jgi:hypothetical protein